MPLDTAIEVMLAIGDGLCGVGEIVSWFVSPPSSPGKDRTSQQSVPNLSPPDVTETYLD